MRRCRPTKWHDNGLCTLIPAAAAGYITSQLLLALLPGFPEQLGAVASPYRLLMLRADWLRKPRELGPGNSLKTLPIESRLRLGLGGFEAEQESRRGQVCPEAVRERRRRPL